MKKLFILLTIVGLATTLTPVSAHAGRLAFDAAGNLFVGDLNSYSVFKYTPDETKSTFATYLSPYCMVIDGSGNLFVGDFNGHSIIKYTPDGTESTFATGVSPHHMVVDGAGNLFVGAFVAEDKSHSGFKFTPEGVKSTYATGLDWGGMGLDRAGNLFVGDDKSHSIFKFTPDGIKSTFASGLGTLNGVTFDSTGNFFASEVHFEKGDSVGAILKFTPEGVKSTFASGLKAPSDMIVDGAGNLFVAVRVAEDSHSIFKFAPDGAKSTFATGFHSVDGLVFDRSGNLFVADVSSQSIFQFTPGGTKSTFAAPLPSPYSAEEAESPSPDGRFAFITTDKAGNRGFDLIEKDSGKVLLRVSEEEQSSWSVLWAPDSKRFALMTRTGHGSHAFQEVSVYFRSGDTFREIELPKLPEANIPDRLVRPGKTANSNWPEASEWTKDGSLVVTIHTMIAGDSGSVTATRTALLGFDRSGKARIVESRIKFEIEEPEEEEVSADASFRDADRQLNEIYNALRARLSPSERDSLKKEQFAWLNQRNVAVQVAKKNAHENPTDGADREVTKMTKARVAELEKRLKKGK